MYNFILRLTVGKTCSSGVGSFVKNRTGGNEFARQGLNNFLTRRLREEIVESYRLFSSVFSFAILLIPTFEMIDSLGSEPIGSLWTFSELVRCGVCGNRSVDVPSVLCTKDEDQ